MYSNRGTVSGLFIGFFVGFYLRNVFWEAALPRHHTACLDASRVFYSGDAHKELELQASMNTSGKARVRDPDGSQIAVHAAGDEEVARRLQEKVRVLCWIMTSAATLKSRAVHLRNTWGKRCDVLLFASDQEDPLFPTIPVASGSGRGHLTARTMKTFDYVYAHHFQDADWFMKADDDTYVIMENLRYFLSSEDPDEAVSFGHHFKPARFEGQAPAGYNSGGAGYVVSKEALARFGARGEAACEVDGEFEDMRFAKCLSGLGVRIGDSRDALNRTRFHCLAPAEFLPGGPTLADWYKLYNVHGARQGTDVMSDYPISFHYIRDLRTNMYTMEYLIYHAQPYGIQTRHRDLNKRKSTVR